MTQEKLYIQKEVIEFLSTNLPVLRPMEQELIESSCPGCGDKIRFPLIARRQDIEAFQRLLNIAEEVIIEEGVTTRILYGILDKINLGLTIQKALKTRGD